MSDHYDVIVIGSGAGGGTLTHALAPTGKRVLLLERGGFMPREVENWDSKAVWLDKRYANAGKWTDAATERGPAAQDRPDVTFYRAFADPQCQADLPVHQSGGHQQRNFALARRQNSRSPAVR